MRTQPLGSAAIIVLVVVALAAVFAGQLAPYPPFQNHPDSELLGPNGTYWLGTDRFGRDTLSRTLYGARVSLQVGVVATIVVVIVSMTLGVTSAYLGGVWDYVVGRCIDVVQAIPFLVLLLPMTIIFGRGLYSIGMVLGVLIGLVASRVLRAAAMNVIAQPYIEVAQSTGATHMRILLRHIIPNVAPLVIVIASINIGVVIIAEASLSFLGYGVDQTTNVSWGAMLSADGRRHMVTQPWLFVVPVVSIALVIFSINMFGDALRDKLDPRLRGTR